MTATTQHTLPGQLIGTLQYMSPEQCEDPHDVDTRSDVYSLGVVLYELLADRLPYDISTTTVYKAIKIVMEHSPEPLSKINPRLRGDVDAIVRKALAKDRTQRYRSAADLAADLERHLRGDPTEARPPTMWERSVRWTARHPVSVTALICLTLGVSITLTFVASAWHFVTRRPHHLKLSPSRHEAQLTDYLRLPFGEPWRTNFTPSGFEIAELVKSSLPRGPRQLVLLNFVSSDPVDYGRLCAFDANTPHAAPVWVSRIDDNELPKDVRDRGRSGAAFGLNRWLIADIFDKLPGDELVAVFADASSARLVRVYDFAGRVCYQVWVDGPVELYWMKGAKLLALAVRYKGRNWPAGEPTGTKEPEPHFLLALKPALNEKDTEFLPPCERGDSPLRARWCFQLYPNAVSDRVIRHLVDIPNSPANPAHAVQYNMVFDSLDGPAGWWTIDEDGRAIDEHGRPTSRPSTNDAYKLERARGLPSGLPDSDDLRLEPCNCQPVTALPAPNAPPP